VGSGQVNEPIAPLTPPDGDLQDFPFTPIYRARLFGSRFHARATDAEWRAGVTLWLKSWDQKPAGSLPDDDVDLCRLAELGRDLKAWAKVKAGALRGWMKGTDGLLYHATVAEGVNEALERKDKHKSRGAKGAAARWHKQEKNMQQAQDGDALSINGHATSILEPMLSDGNRQGQGEGKKDSELRSAPKTAQDALWADGLPILADLLKKPVDKTLRGFLGKLVSESGGKPQEVMRALWDAQRVNPVEPAAWLLKAVIPKSRQLSSAELLAEEQSRPSPTNPRGYKVSPLIGT
jgi:hypothetical protein